jgi:hypothetical protein
MRVLGWMLVSVVAPFVFIIGLGFARMGMG